MRRGSVVEGVTRSRTGNRVDAVLRSVGTQLGPVLFCFRGRGGGALTLNSAHSFKYPVVKQQQYYRNRAHAKIAALAAMWPPKIRQSVTVKQREAQVSLCADDKDKTNRKHLVLYRQAQWQKENWLLFLICFCGTFLYKYGTVAPASMGVFNG